MSKAEQLATDIDQGNYSLRDLKEAAALLRQQDALLRQALEALESVAGKGKLCNAAIEAIKEALK